MEHDVAIVCVAFAIERVGGQRTVSQEARDAKDLHVGIVSIDRGLADSGLRLPRGGRRRVGAPRIAFDNLATMAVVASMNTGDGQIIGSTREGESIATDVLFIGGGGGASLALFVQGALDNMAADLDITGADDDGDGFVPLRDLFGTYTGVSYSGAALIGFGGRFMVNEAGVSFAVNDFGVGASAALGVDTLSLVVDED